jgi:FixJ family two-component response regulator
VKNPPTVFIVDDRPAVLRSLRETVTAHSFSAQCYDSAAQFIADQDSNQVGCILVDLLSAQGGLILRWLHESDSVLSIVPISGLIELSTSVPKNSPAPSPHQLSTLLNMLTDGIAGSIGRQVIRERTRE